MSGTHAYLPPSGAAAWVQCALWPLMNATYPQEGDEGTAEGDAFHWLSFMTIKGFPEANIPNGTRAPNGVVIDEEMQEGLEIVVNSLDFGLRDEFKIEERMHGRRVHATLNNGTPDLGWYKFGNLHVYDWKYGHEFVDEFENWQLINYAAFWLEKLQAQGVEDHMVMVHLHVVQPRAYHPRGSHRVWTIRGSDLRAYINILAGAAERAIVANPVATTGPSCKHCPGRHACEPFQQVAGTAIELSKQAFPMEMPPAALGSELRMLWAAKDRLAARITGLEAEAEKLVRSGVNVPHTMLEASGGREGWAKPIEEIVALGQLMGVSTAKIAVITPNQARKLGIPKEVVAEYATRPSGSTKLVLDDGSKARRAFGA